MLSGFDFKNQSLPTQARKRIRRQTKFDERIGLILDNLHQHYGIPWITASDMFSVIDIALNSIYGYLDTPRPSTCQSGLMAHKFWSWRITIYASLGRR